MLGTGLLVLAFVAYLATACGETKTVTRTVTVVQPSRAALRGDADAEAFKVSPSLGIKCGVELWPIKTLIDANAGKVQLDPALPASIAAINELPRPADPTTRLGDEFELSTYLVTAFLVGYKLEDDNDWHLVLSDDGSEKPGHTMIVEIPSAACAQPPLEPKASPVLAQMIEARTAFETAFPAANACFSCKLKSEVTVLGVGFFDRLHDQHGLAKNGAELHPVLGFAVGGGPPPPGATSKTKTVPKALPGQRYANGCRRYPGRHWLAKQFHLYCRATFFFTKNGA